MSALEFQDALIRRISPEMRAGRRRAFPRNARTDFEIIHAEE
jgi:hypothetical protein